MRSYILFAIILLGLTPPVAAADGQPDLREGAWNITVKPAEKSPGALPLVQMVCLTPSEPVPQPATTGNCRLLSTQIQGNTVYWVSECQEVASVVNTVGSVTYAGTRVTGGLQVTIAAPDALPQIKTFKLTGRRQGVCPSAPDSQPTP